MDSSYDEVPYTSFPYARTHPDRLCALGWLFGISARLPSAARVLELGCGAGGNLIPMAYHLPGSEFVGVDLSQRQISQGRTYVGDIGLRNVDLRHASILSITQDWGHFDYVICHGVYSWVDRPVQEKILAVCRQLLAPNGIAYVSYNTYPGWHLRESVRHMMRFHVAGFESPAQRVAQARALIGFLVDAVADDRGPYGALLNKELAVLARTGDDYLYHEHLEDQNRPIYFHEFAQRIEQAGLQYLCESDLHLMLPNDLAPAVRENLDRVAPDLLRMEQYLDFVRNRQFRASLICHQEVTPNRSLGPDTIADLRFGFHGEFDERPADLSDGVAHGFPTAQGRTVTTTSAVTKAALVVLRRMWPRDTPFTELYVRALATLAEAGIAEPDTAGRKAALATDLVQCLMSAGGLDIRVEAPPLKGGVADKPWLPVLSRLQARDFGFATNARHSRIDLDGYGIEVAVRCDGSRTRSQLAREAAAAYRERVSRSSPPGTQVPFTVDSDEQTSTILTAVLDRFAALGLFVEPALPARADGLPHPRGNGLTP